ncbi:MAG: glycosyltransferase [Bacilli bacterium]|nr:glycosyltransferase [Bacilli bacterium]MBN2696557.1 glycosyltransferase [Bacilli bacterium]
MIIVFVIDNYGEFSNGTTVTALRSKQLLEARGHTVRIVSAGPPENENYFQLKKRRIPIISKAAAKQNMYFAKFDRKIMTDAFKDADVIHFFLPFKVTQKGIELAKKMDVPFTAAFHSQPENVTYGMGLGKLGMPIAWALYQKYLNQVYNKVTHVHCPTEYIAKEIVRQGFINEAHVISNGISDVFYLQSKTISDDRFRILSVGRYAMEKKQEVILKAVSMSKYRDSIDLTLAGAGPREGKLRRLAKKLGLDVKFGFFSQQQLIEIIRNTDLYVHAAEAEIEGIACLEAIASGIVPVIAKSRTSAAWHFTLDERSLFPTSKPKALVKKIDYWIENADERTAMSKEYARYAENYRLEHSVDLLEEMFKQAIEDKRRELVARSRSGKKIRKRICLPYFKRALSFMIYYFIAIPFLWIYLTLLVGVKFRNRSKLKQIKGGAILISNHVHTLDSAMNGIAAFPRKPVFTGLKANFKLPVAGFLVNILGTVPVPETLEEMKVFFFEMTRQARSGRFIHFFPEGELKQYDKELRPFKKGAFQVAEEASVPVVPIGISFQDKKWIFPLLSPHKVILSVGDPIYPDNFKLKREAIQELNLESFEQMNELIQSKA